MNFWQRLPQPIIGLSPMDGVTDAAFRLIVAQQGPADVSVTEFTSVGDICRGPEFLLCSLLYSDLERPVVAQLYGKDPDLFRSLLRIGTVLACPDEVLAEPGVFDKVVELGANWRDEPTLAPTRDELLAIVTGSGVAG